MIICAAVEYIDKTGKHSDQIIRGHRHWDCYRTITRTLDKDWTSEWGKYDWFVDHLWDFNNRQTAFSDAYEYWQISEETYNRVDQELYSEDIY